MTAGSSRTGSLPDVPWDPGLREPVRLFLKYIEGMEDDTVARSVTRHFLLLYTGPSESHIWNWINLILYREQSKEKQHRLTGNCQVLWLEHKVKDETEDKTGSRRWVPIALRTWHLTQ